MLHLAAQAPYRRRPLSSNVSLHMARTRIFQLLVLASLASYLLWFLLPYSPRAFPKEVSDLLAWGGYGSHSWAQHPLFYLSIGLGKVVSSIGLLLFLSWGRWLLLAIVVVSVASVPFSGMAISVPLDTVVGSLTGLTDGAILALAFFSPLSEAMRKDE